MGYGDRWAAMNEIFILILTFATRTGDLAALAPYVEYTKNQEVCLARTNELFAETDTNGVMTIRCISTNYMGKMHITIPLENKYDVVTAIHKGNSRIPWEFATDGIVRRKGE